MSTEAEREERYAKEWLETHSFLPQYLAELQGLIVSIQHAKDRQSYLLSRMPASASESETEQWREYILLGAFIKAQTEQVTRIYTTTLRLESDA